MISTWSFVRRLTYIVLLFFSMVHSAPVQAMGWSFSYGMFGQAVMNSAYASLKKYFIGFWPIQRSAMNEPFNRLELEAHERYTAFEAVSNRYVANTRLHIEDSAKANMRFHQETVEKLQPVINKNHELDGTVNGLRTSALKHATDINKVGADLKECIKQIPILQRDITELAGVKEKVMVALGECLKNHEHAFNELKSTLMERQAVQEALFREQLNKLEESCKEDATQLNSMRIEFASLGKEIEKKVAINAEIEAQWTVVAKTWDAYQNEMGVLTASLNNLSLGHGSTGSGQSIVKSNSVADIKAEFLPNTLVPKALVAPAYKDSVDNKI